MKRGDMIAVSVYGPETEEAGRELAKRVAMVHAQTVMEKVGALSCPAEQKARLVEAVISGRRDPAEEAGAKGGPL